MTERQDRSITAYQSARDAIDALPGPLSRELTRLRDDLQQTLNEIARVTADRRSTGPTLGQLRLEIETLREKQMLPLGRLARRLFLGDPAIEKALRVPHKRASNDELLESAMTMTKTLRPHRRFLARSGIEPARLDQLARSARDAKQRVRHAERTRGQRGVAMIKLKPFLTRARHCVNAIDAIVVATMPPDEIHRWRKLARVGKRIGRPPKRRSHRSPPR